jgi:asparagine synthase (glutamine-hydrolysing)
MCGLVAMFGQISDVAEQRRLAALESIRHRGPDGRGQWSDAAAWLGHLRLAIIDLSPAGAQPMIDPDSGLVIIFNGEIYNYIELRDELKAQGVTFRTQSDTEVLLLAYRTWGAQACAKLNGMWAFAIWDPAKRTVFFSRDRFGVKPLLYSVAEKGRGRLLAMASEAKAIHALLPETLAPNPQAVARLVSHSISQAGAETFYEKIHYLPPAHCATFDVASGALKVSRYWDYPPLQRGPQPRYEAQCETFAALFEDAVKLRLRSDVSVGLTLSGGLDSSAILAAASANLSRPLACYTSVYSSAERGELGWAKIAADAAGSEVIPVEASFASFLETLEQATHHMDAPGYSPAVIPLWEIMKQARATSTPVILEGQGGDELLGGYPAYTASHGLEALSRGNVIGFTRTAAVMGATFGAKATAAWLFRKAAPDLTALLTSRQRLNWLTADLRQMIASGFPADPSMSTVGSDYPAMQAAMWRDHSHAVLPALLHYGDAISMAHGIESRLPFMDYRLIEWSFSAPRDLTRDGGSKAPLRHYLDQKGLRKTARRKDKLGYPVPMVQWINGPGAGHLAALLADRNRPLWQFFDQRAISKLVAASKQNPIAMFHLYKIVGTDIWLNLLRERSASTAT